MGFDCVTENHIPAWDQWPAGPQPVVVGSHTRQGGFISIGAPLSTDADGFGWVHLATGRRELGELGAGYGNKTTQNAILYDEKNEESSIFDI